MGAQTPSYVVSTKVQLPESIAKRLEKVFVFRTVLTMRH